ncbi:TPA: hypothetical protein CPT92_04880 [Candidatus Gastranaerophilales bacterium HUM_13]|jgi:glycosyltransferase involved in cell wall biosynthesis|nr:glycosyltransferase [Acinetobacter sp.]DAA94939.1 MAG TPA: hypothetical protein CPT88_07750 [Candidatus Gastranaerophilales bacterium HUM_8]DAA98041.1 MAG TPA: hypothetical protein CPT96_11585 [Candidatus Gastranaerophilales bacterium HUM_10]DAB04483.1 MAG TPA: hypothetical protein CPT89_01820 [Candidatus Gastranaerophilales bacterium HUM_11]DAB07695.1 MAG TPA: hypothetical protein CPT92_04880 [Candidatus Gastranaerophilales bacterium HUM_13]DAB12987.1 MAG TPA: hypothetical protein CPT91_01
MHTKVSVILPIYNQEKYLAKALTSLQNQTLKEAEFICVNDGSKDNSLTILNDYAAKDSRVKIINQKNQGAGCARNNGLKAAKGEYIAFLDPDDWFEPDALETLYNKSKRQNCDMVVFNFNKVGENGNILGRYNLHDRLQRFYDIKEDENFYWRDIKPRILGGMHPASWNKFYKHELIKKHRLHFANCSLAEDNVFVFGASLNAAKIGYSDKCLYNYLIRQNSAIRSKSDKNFCLFRSIDCVKKLINNLGLAEELKNEFDGYILRFVSYHIKQIVSVTKFKEICQKKLSPLQNQMLNERYNANSKLMPIIEALLTKKIKTEFQKFI